MASFDDDWVTRHVTVRDVMLHRTGVSRSYDELWLMKAYDRKHLVRYVSLLPVVRVQAAIPTPTKVRVDRGLIIHSAKASRDQTPLQKEHFPPCGDL